MDKIIFLSHIIDEKTPTYGNKGGISFEKIRCMDKGDSCNEMHWSFGNHTGTHLDAPRHFIKDGKTVDEISASGWYFKKIALVNVPKIKPGMIISSEQMGKLKKDTELILIKTGFEGHRHKKIYWENSPAFHSELADSLKRSCPRLRAIGTDLISISNINNRELGRAAHREFLGREIILIEDMKLSSIKSAPKKILVAPIRVKEGDGAPCSIFAWSA